MYSMLVRTLGLILMFVSVAVVAADFDVELGAIQEEWAVIKYDKPAKEQAAAYERLMEKTSEFVRSFSNRAEPLIWDAIVRGSYAGAKGGLGALSYVKQARSELEQAIQIDANALSGSAYTTLGNLYHKVPGWPIGFGSDKKANDYFKKALAISPDGIDPNYFYGEFLFDLGKTDEAVFVLQHALAAPDRPGRARADEGRRQEIRELLAKAQQH